MQALLVLDVVNAIFSLPVPLHDADGFVERIRALCERARASRVPVIHFRQVGTEGSIFAGQGRDLDVRVGATPEDLLIDKTEPDMFLGTSLASLLVERGIEEVVICGFATEGCVDTTVRSAWSKGFRVVLASGAHTTTANPVLTAEQVVQHHDFVLKRFARVMPASEIVFANRPG